MMGGKTARNMQRAEKPPETCRALITIKNIV
jgi:hypothetical protein